MAGLIITEAAQETSKPSKEDCEAVSTAEAVARSIDYLIFEGH